MKVIRIVSELDFGGVEQVVANSVPEMVNDLKMDVKVVVLGRGGRVEKELVKKGVSVIVLQQNPRIPNFKLLNGLRKFLKQEKPDVVHCQGAEANFHGILAANWAGIKNIIGEEIGIPNHHSYWKYIFRGVYANAHQVIAISEAVKKYIVDLKEVPANKVSLLYNPVGFFNKSMGISAQRKEAFVFITTCRLVPVKNLDRFVEVFGRLVNSDYKHVVEWWIVGEGPMEETLKRQVKEKGLERNVKFLGFQKDVFMYLKQADVFCLPSLSEGSSVSLVEAMSMGLPSIVTSVGGAREILGVSESGILVDPIDEGSLFNALSFMINLPKDQMEDMGKRAVLESKRFSKGNYLEELMLVYAR